MTGALPYRLTTEAGEPQIEWVWSDGRRFPEPFFQDTVARLTRGNARNRPASRPRTPLGALTGIVPGLPVAGIVFHVSRCGSTLLAQMLAAVPNNLVVSEPQIIDDILRAPLPTDDERIALLRGAVHALGQPPAGGARRLFLKTDCWHLLSLPLLRRAFPDAPFIFVYRHPVEVLVSLMRQPSFTLVRDTVTPAQLGLTPAERDALSREEYAAAILGAFFRAARQHRAMLTPIAYEQLPDIVPTVIPQAVASDAERAQLIAAASINAKNPSVPFLPDTAEKRQQATTPILAAAARWAEPAYREWVEAARD